MKKISLILLFALTLSSCSILKPSDDDDNEYTLITANGGDNGFGNVKLITIDNGIFGSSASTKIVATNDGDQQLDLFIGNSKYYTGLSYALQKNQRRCLRR